MKPLKFDAIIVGAGMTGLATAIALAKQNCRIALIDKGNLTHYQTADFDRRVSAISQGSQHIFEALNVWDTMQHNGQPITDIIVHEKNGFGHVHYDQRNAGNQPMGHIVENRYIREPLIKHALANPNITLFAPDEVVSYETSIDRVSLILKSNQTLSASLLIAADGKFSKLRQDAAIEVIERDYKQKALVATIRHEHEHYGLALERFFATGPFAVLPMQGKFSSLVWVEPTATANSILALPDEIKLAYLNDKLDGYLGKVTLESDFSSYPLTAKLAKKMIAERLILMGDAAHAIHPIAGQGVNLGFRDVAVLENVIADATYHGADIGSHAVLKKHQQQRWLDNASMFVVTDGLTHVFSNNNKLLSILRNTGFALVNQTPPIRDRLMRHAMGLTQNVLNRVNT